MRNIPIDDIDDTPRPLVAIHTDYADGQVLPWHRHRRVQLLYGATGVMHVATRAGNWVVPPGQAVWIPAEEAHQVRMLGVSTHSLYLEPDAVIRPPPVCQVVKVSPLLRQLLAEAVKLPLLYDRDGRDGILADLVLHELARLSSLPFHIPLPGDERLQKVCRAFLDEPDIHARIDHWLPHLAMSERTFSRLFKQQTGLSFLRWKQQACVVLALERLTAGESITRIALEYGYDSPASFSTMFRRRFGQPPSHYRPDRPGHRPD
ncbi:AraC family transcriptional regulator [Alloalcanivorax xenomutans]|uniref:AraC family transcriptional regulator n=2 Tax=Alloalcanivorax xenomutans TaxID=1094342 RepID=UPI00047BBE8A